MAKQQPKKERAFLCYVSAMLMSWVGWLAGWNGTCKVANKHSGGEGVAWWPGPREALPVQDYCESFRLRRRRTQVANWK